MPNTADIDNYLRSMGSRNLIPHTELPDWVDTDQIRMVEQGMVTKTDLTDYLLDLRNEVASADFTENFDIDVDTPMGVT